MRLHRASTGKHWRTGVFLRHPIDAYASEALLELRDGQHLIMEVRAPSPDLFFNVIRDTVENLITRRWPGLTYELWVPCPTRYAKHKLCTGKFKLGTLLRFREIKKHKTDCLECAKEHDVGALLTGFPAQQPSLQAELDRIHEGMQNIANGVVRIERYAADAAESARRIMKAIGTEVTDCPRLFTLTLEKARGMGLTKLAREHYRLVLWCEHPGHWHSQPAASYLLTKPKDRLSRIGPYAIFVFKTLRLVVPIAAAVAGVVLTPEQMKQDKREIELMKVLVENLPHGDPLPDELSGLLPTHIGSTEGQSLRAFRSILLAEDPNRIFGGLRRVNTSSGEYLWVCDIHYPKYDPGLPRLPGLEPD